MGRVVTVRTFVSDLARESGVDERTAHDVFRGLTVMLTKGLRKDGRFYLPKVGKFWLKLVRPRRSGHIIGDTQENGYRIDPQRKVLKFTVCDDFSKYVREMLSPE